MSLRVGAPLTEIFTSDRHFQAAGLATQSNDRVLPWTLGMTACCRCPASCWSLRRHTFDLYWTYRAR